MSSQDYEFVKIIGEGSYGKASLCKVKATEELVVVKEISLRSLSPQEQEDTRKETKILSLLHHPNIIGYKADFIEKGVLYIIMEYANNGDLFEQIQNAKGKNFPEEQILDWFTQICLGLKHCHDRKILHRDIKCQNVFLMKNGICKLGDFGIAKVLDHTTSFARTAIGTPYYLSPEICNGQPYNTKSDIWALGCLLYELCTLNHAFDSNCMNGLILKILRAKQAPIPSIYSENLRQLVDSLLCKSQKKRPSINQILQLPFIASRLDHLLSSTMKKIEFSHTVFHGAKGGETPIEFQTNTELSPIPEARAETPKTSPKASTDPKRDSRKTGIPVRKPSAGSSKIPISTKTPPKVTSSSPSKPTTTTRSTRSSAAARPPSNAKSPSTPKKTTEKKPLETTGASPSRPPRISAEKRDEERQKIKDMIKKKRAEKKAQDKDDDTITIGTVKVAVEKPGKENTPQIKKQGLVSVEQLIADYTASEEQQEKATDELIDFAAAAQNMVDCPPDFEDESDGREDDTEVFPEINSVIGGKNLHLPAVRGKQNLKVRIDSLRKFIENGIGLDAFLAAYHFVTEGSNGLTDEQYNQQIRRLLPNPQAFDYYPLIQQLVSLEETAQSE